jgi:hypothetical protein
MGNSINCTAVELSVAQAHGPHLSTAGGLWNCSNGVSVFGAGNTSCVATFLLVPDAGPSVAYNGCVSSRDRAPPGHARRGDELWWCSGNDTLHSTPPNASEVWGECRCEQAPPGPLPPPNNNWIWGILCSVVSSMLTTVGTLMQKIVHNANDRKPADKKAPEVLGLLLSPAWLFAFLIMVILPLPFNILGLALAAQSLIVVFAGLTIVLNVFAARVMLGERADRVELTATAVIVVGLVFATVGGPKEDDDFGPCDILQRYGEQDFIVGTAALGCMLAVSLYGLHVAEQTPRVVRCRPLLYAFCAGGFGGVGNMFLKAGGELAAGAFTADSNSVGAWSTPHPYYNLVLALVFCVLQLANINQGLRRYSAIMFLPMYNTCFVLLAGYTGALMYREFAKYSTLQWVLFPTGVSITLCGILIMTRKDPAAKESEQRVSPSPLASVSPSPLASPRAADATSMTKGKQAS